MTLINFIPVILLFSLIFFAFVPLLLSAYIGRSQGLHRARGAAGLVFLLYLISFVALLTMNQTIVKVDSAYYQEPFTYSSSPLLGDDTNLTQATAMHEVLLESGLKDPSGFAFADFPSSESISREIWMEPTNPYYTVHLGVEEYASLLQVPTSSLEDLASLKTYAENFFRIPDGMSHLISISTSIFDGFPTDTFRVEVRITLPSSLDTIILVLDYNPNSGFADFFNMVYTTRDYSIHAPGVVFFEVAYRPQTLGSIGMVVEINMILTSVLMVIFPLFVLLSKEGSDLQKFLFPSEKDGGDKGSGFF